jgi:uncharacterized protein (TIGR03000 family)
MTKLGIAGVAGLALAMLAPDAMAQRRGGGAVSGGVRGAMVGGLVGGESGAQTGAKVGAVTGATRGVAERSAQRNAMNAETQALAQYETAAAYQNAQHSNFNEAPPEVMVDSSSAESAAAGKESVLRKDGKPVVGITYPPDWKQKTGDSFVSAVSKDGHAWSAIALLEGAKDKQAGIDKVKQGLEKYLQDISYDDPTTTQGGALVLTGTGKSKKSGVGVVFAAGVFDSGGGQLAGAAFVVDQDVEQYYKETVRYICQTIRRGQDSEASYRGFSAPTTATTARITVRVAPDAQIWFDDTATKQTGALREFESTPLTPGKTYTYDIRAQWRENGREVTQSRHVGVHAGGRVTVDFTSPSAQDNAAPPTVSPPPPPGPSGR